MVFQNVATILPPFRLWMTLTKSLGKNEKIWGKFCSHKQFFFVMMNKCAKFYKDSPSGTKVKFNLARAIELSETADFVYNFV